MSIRLRQTLGSDLDYVLKAERSDETARHVVDQILSALGNIEEPSEAVE